MKSTLHRRRNSLKLLTRSLFASSQPSVDTPSISSSCSCFLSLFLISDLCRVSVICVEWQVIRFREFILYIVSLNLNTNGFQLVRSKHNKYPSKSMMQLFWNWHFSALDNFTFRTASYCRTQVSQMVTSML